MEMNLAQTPRNGQPAPAACDPLHGDIVPREIRRGEAFRAEILEINGETHALQARAWRLSPLAGEFFSTLRDAPTIQPDDLCTLRLSMGTESTLFERLPVRQVEHTGDGVVFGLRWTREMAGARTLVPRREPRWALRTAMRPSGASRMRCQLNDTMYFTVSDLSRHGARLSTSLRNKLLFPGMRITVAISFPAMGVISTECRIAWCAPEQEERGARLAVGVAFVDAPKSLVDCIARHLFQFEESADLGGLRKAGLRLHTVSDGLHMQWVQCEGDYERVLRLRARGYDWMTQGDESQWRRMADEFDSRSRIMMVMHRDTLIATCRLVFHQAGDLTEQEQYVQFDDSFPPRESMVEVTRMCILPEYRRSDVLHYLLQHMIVAAVLTGRSWILGCSTPPLRVMYQRLGARDTGLEYESKALDGTRMRVILFDVVNLLKGCNVSPALWRTLGKDCVEYLLHAGAIRLSPIDRLRLSAFHLVNKADDLRTGARKLLRRMR